jgi:hypothetical protein
MSRRGGDAARKDRRRKLAPGIAIRASQINGKGCFTTVRFPEGRKIAEFAGGAHLAPRGCAASRLARGRARFLDIW